MFVRRLVLGIDHPDAACIHQLRGEAVHLEKKESDGFLSKLSNVHLASCGKQSLSELLVARGVASCHQTSCAHHTI